MPEGDTLARIAAGLRPVLAGRVVTGARARLPGPRVDRIVGATITEVVAVGKNLLIRLDNGLELRTHLRMHGSWHRYRTGERWRRAPSRAKDCYSGCPAGDVPSGSVSSTSSTEADPVAMAAATRPADRRDAREPPARRRGLIANVSGVAAAGASSSGASGAS